MNDAPPARDLQAKYRLVMRLAESLKQHPLVVDPPELKFSFTMGEDAVESPKPDEHLFRSLLVEVRPFLLAGEDVNLAGVLNSAIRHIDDAEVVHAIEVARWTYRGVRGGVGRFTVEGKELTATESVDLWLNSEYFHHAYAKEQRLQAMPDFVRLWARFSFVVFIVRVCALVIWVGSALREAERRGAIRDTRVAPARSHPHEARQEDPATIGDRRLAPITIVYLDELEA